MKLRNFSILSIFAVICFFILFHLIASEFIVKKGFQKLEDRQTQVLVNTARRTLNLNLSNLDRLLIDWANWDDSYDFVQRPTSDYIQSNLPIDTFLDQSLVCVVFQNRKNDIIYLNAINQGGEFDKALANEMFRQLSTNYPFATNGLNIQKGMLTFESGETAMIARRPILTSSASGPAMGTIMFIRIISQAMLNEISSLLDADISLVSLDETKGIWGKVMQSQDRVFILHENEMRLEGFGGIMDIKGTPSVLIKVATNPIFSQEGQHITHLFFSMLTFAILLFSVIGYFILHVKVLKRLESLMHQISRHEASPGEAPPHFYQRQ